jgi:uncharacterized membrane protein YjgN (DUF898 family)
MTANPRSLVSHAQLDRLYPLYIKHLLLSIVTLGFYRFFTKTEIRKYLWNSLELDGERFEYTGKGMELLIGFFKAVGIAILGYAAWIAAWMSTNLFVLQYMLPDMEREQRVAVSAGITFAFVFILMLALMWLGLVGAYGASRYRLSRTTYRGVHFKLEGGSFEYARKVLARLFLTIVTLGLYGPFAAKKDHAYVINNMRYGSYAFRFDDKAPVLFGKYVIALLLTVPTLGWSWIWYGAEQMRNFTEHTSIGDMKFSSKVTGGRYLWLMLSNLFLLVVSLGLLYPLVVQNNIAFWCNNLVISGDLDFTRVEQVESTGGATSEGLAALLDSEMI